MPKREARCQALTPDCGEDWGGRRREGPVKEEGRNGRI